jgi:hypothetical protein
MSLYDSLRLSVRTNGVIEELALFDDLEMNVTSNVMTEEQGITTLISMLQTQCNRMATFVKADPSQMALQAIAKALPALRKVQHLESFSGTKEENPEQWLKKFILVVGINGWDEDLSMMSKQFVLHLKAPASDWWQERESEYSTSTWEEVQEAFLARFKRSVTSVAMDLVRMRQRPDESVRQFAERFGKLQAKFPGKNEELKVAEFTDKLLPRYGASWP